MKCLELNREEKLLFEFRLDDGDGEGDIDIGDDADDVDEDDDDEDDFVCMTKFLCLKLALKSS